VLKLQILEFDRMITAWHRSSEASKRLDQVPGVGPLLAAALVASVAEPKAFRSGRDFSAWIGLVPKQNSSGGKERLGNIGKRGDRYLRSLFTTGALAVIRYANPWHQASPLAHRVTRAATHQGRGHCARQQARPMARAMMAEGELYKEPAALCGVTRSHRTNTRRDVKVGRANSM